MEEKKIEDLRENVSHIMDQMKQFGALLEKHETTKKTTDAEELKRALITELEAKISDAKKTLNQQFSRAVD